MTSSMKLLLLWHYRFGHRNLHDVHNLLKVAAKSSSKRVVAINSDAKYVKLRKVDASQLEAR
jgi:hypothetical protein